jgi:hypothetical protein
VSLFSQCPIQLLCFVLAWKTMVWCHQLGSHPANVKMTRPTIVLLNEVQCNALGKGLELVTCQRLVKFSVACMLLRRRALLNPFEGLAAARQTLEAQLPGKLSQTMSSSGEALLAAAGAQRPIQDALAAAQKVLVRRQAPAPKPKREGPEGLRCAPLQTLCDQLCSEALHAALLHLVRAVVGVRTFMIGACSAAGRHADI